MVGQPGADESLRGQLKPEELSLQQTKQIVDNTFIFTKAAIKNLGWTGSLISPEGGLKDFINPGKGELNHEYTADYPRQLLSLVEILKGKDTNINVDPKWLSLINLAYVYNRAITDAGGDASKFNGELGDLENKPYFKLALLLTKRLDDVRGNPWAGLLAATDDESKFKNYLNNGGDETRTNENFPYFKREELEKIPGLSIDSQKQNFSIKDVVMMISQNVR
jgi:hypothetical protein